MVHMVVGTLVGMGMGKVGMVEGMVHSTQAYSVVVGSMDRSMHFYRNSSLLALQLQQTTLQKMQIVCFS